MNKEFDFLLELEPSILNFEDYDDLYNILNLDIFVPKKSLYLEGCFTNKIKMFIDDLSSQQIFTPIYYDQTPFDLMLDTYAIEYAAQCEPGFLRPPLLLPTQDVTNKILALVQQFKQERPDQDFAFIFILDSRYMGNYWKGYSEIVNMVHIVLERHAIDSNIWQVRNDKHIEYLLSKLLK